MIIQIPKKIQQTIQKTKRNLVLYGGRGSAKSQSIARILLAEARQSKLRILCCREVQNSIADSVHSLLKDIINEYEEFQNFFHITDKEITGANGSQFIFRGLKKETAGSIKSIEGIDICWIEEAQFISRHSLGILVPTIRKENSKIIYTMNPTNNDDPVYVDYVLIDREDTVKCEVNYYDNAFFPNVLKKEMEWDRSHDTDKYNHIWLGKTVKHSEAQIFKDKWIIDNFETPENMVFYHGADFGFANDASTLIRCYIKDNCLWIDYEVYGIGIEIDDLSKAYDIIPTSRQWKIYGDNSRPETISYLKRQGFNIQSCDKWQGCIEDRIAYIKNFDKIIVHERCKHTQDEFRLYSYKTDRQTGIILPIVEDKNNHCFNGNTKILMGNNKYKKIKNIKLGEYVLTRAGNKKVIKIFINKKNINKYNINNINIKSTNKHNIFINKENKKYIYGLTVSDTCYIYKQELYIWLKIKIMFKLLFLKTLNLDVIQILKMIQIENILSVIAGIMLKELIIYTEKYGKKKMEIFQKGLIFIIKIIIFLIIIFQTLKLLKIKNIYLNMAKNVLLKIKNGLKSFIQLALKKLKNGINQKKVMNGIKNMLLHYQKVGYIEKKKNVFNVKKNILQKEKSVNFVLINANQNLEEIIKLIMLKKNVNDVLRFLKQINIQALCIVQEVVYKKINGKELKNQKVYNLMIDDKHEYFANNILVSNCIDSIGYALNDFIKNKVKVINLTNYSAGNLGL
jgi:phage terminase large subunit